MKIGTYRGKEISEMSRDELLEFAIWSSEQIEKYMILETKGSKWHETSFEEGYAVARRLYEPIAQEMLENVDKWLKERRNLEVSALESSKLVPDRHYHKGKIHLIDDLLSSLDPNSSEKAEEINKE